MFPKISISRMGLMTFFIVFYLGFNALGLISAIVKGEITSWVQAIKFINPIESLHYYNNWFYESYQQYQTSSDLAKQNSFIGMIISGIGIFLPMVLSIVILKSLFRTEDLSGEILLIFGLFIFMSSIYIIVGGFDAFIKIVSTIVGLK